MPRPTDRPPARRRVLVLAGTAEAAELAGVLAARPGPDALSLAASFAGRTRQQAVLPDSVAVRVGGFGGVDGLVDHLRADGVDLLVDATHPFAARMPHHAAAAAGRVGVPRLRLLRPGWAEQDGDRWHRVPDLAAAAAELAARDARRVLLTTGRLELAPFAGLADRGVHVVTRSIEPPDPMPLVDATVVLARGPFSVDEERALLREHRIDTVVTKDSGGDATIAKLVAARELGVPVVLVDRPAPPGGDLVGTVAAAVAWVDRHRA